MTGEGDRLRFPRGGTVSLANQAVLAAEILGGRRVGIRIEPATLMFYDLDTRELLRVRPTRWPWTRPAGCAAADPPDHHHAPRSNPSKSSAAPPMAV